MAASSSRAWRKSGMSTEANELRSSRPFQITTDPRRFFEDNLSSIPQRPPRPVSQERMAEIGIYCCASNKGKPK